MHITCWSLVCVCLQYGNGIGEYLQCMGELVFLHLWKEQYNIKNTHNTSLRSCATILKHTYVKIVFLTVFLCIIYLNPDRDSLRMFQWNIFTIFSKSSAANASEFVKKCKMFLVYYFVMINIRCHQLAVCERYASWIMNIHHYKMYVKAI